jgi:uncharacterized membrane protein
MIYQTWGGFSFIGVDLHLMHAIGWVMILIYLHVYFAPFTQLVNAVEEKNLELAAKKLNLIRKLIAVNLTLGIIVIVIASGGRYV